MGERAGGGGWVGGGWGSWRTSELELDDAANSSRGEEMVAGMEEKDK